MENRAFIYALWCPIKEVAFYVGKSTNPVKRLRQHVQDVRAGYFRFRFPHLITLGAPYAYEPRTLWLAWLAVQGLEPELVVLEETSADSTVWLAREKAWTKKLADEGHPLTNYIGPSVGWTHDEAAELQAAMERGRERIWGEKPPNPARVSNEDEFAELMEDAIERGKELLGDLSC